MSIGVPRLALMVSGIGVACMVLAAPDAAGQLPSAYDLRNEGRSTSVKSQRGGTCWAHGTMAAMESNMLTTGAWAAAGEAEEPDLAEYHMDWWNGFNWHNNDDTTPTQQDGNGLQVHQGGDYRVATAYISRGEGAVRNSEGQSYNSAPPRGDPSYHSYYVRDVEWYTAGDDGNDISRIDTVKQAIMDDGAIGTCYYASGYGSTNHYQPQETAEEPNHSVAIVGWDDDRSFSGAPGTGGWLCKNSWGSGWNGDGHLWISYYDKHAGHHPQMGAVSFRNVEPNSYTQTYAHDYHGWRDTLTGHNQAFNAFTADGNEPLRAVSFCTAADAVDYTVRVYDDFTAGQLANQLAIASGSMAVAGYHTADLSSLVQLADGDDFYVQLEVSDGGLAIDRTSEVPVLLSALAVTDGSIVSDASYGESFYLTDGTWYDLEALPLYDSELEREVTGSANFCIKAYSVPEPSPLIALLLLTAVGARRRRSDVWGFGSDQHKSDIRSTYRNLACPANCVCGT